MMEGTTATATARDSDRIGGPEPPMSASAPLRVLHVFPTFAPGGVQLRIADVANRLGPGFAHLCVALDGCHDARTRLGPETQWHTVAETESLKGLRALPAIRRRITGIAPDLLCTYNWGTMDWAVAQAVRPSVPHLHFESGFGPEEARRLLPRRNAMRRLALRSVHRLVAPSQVLIGLAKQHRWIATERLRLVPNGVDTAFYAAAEPPGPCAESLVVSVAPLRPEKRLERLIEAFEEASGGTRARLHLLGSGPCETALRTRAESGGAAARIVFRGHCGDVREDLGAASVFAMTSETEQMPNALLQAMAMGRPVVAFDAGDIKSILPPEQRAFVYPQEDSAGFASGLRRLLEDPGLRSELGAANRARVCRHYSMDTMVESYRRLYREAISQRA